MSVITAEYRIVISNIQVPSVLFQKIVLDHW